MTFCCKPSWISASPRGIDRSRLETAKGALKPGIGLDLGKSIFLILRGADTPTQRRYTLGTWDVVFCGILARRTPRGPGRMPHGLIDLGEEKPTRPWDRTNSSIWENRFSQSYEGRKPPPSAGILGRLGMPCLTADEAPHDHPFKSDLPIEIKQKSINHASSTHHLGISGYWTSSFLF